MVAFQGSCHSEEVFELRGAKQLQPGCRSSRCWRQYSLIHCKHLRPGEWKYGPPKVFLRMMMMIQKVEDVQDQKPVFLNAPYSDTVEEGTPEGTEIFSVQVTLDSQSDSCNDCSSFIRCAMATLESHDQSSSVSKGIGLDTLCFSKQTSPRMG